MKKIIIPILVAAVLWFVMFSPWTVPHLNFWICMSVAASVLLFMSFRWGNNLKSQFTFNLQSILLGIGSAAVLWGVFYVGDAIASQIFPFAKQQVGNIYQLKDGENPLYLALLLTFLVGPAEEIFWHGYVQRSLVTRKGEWFAFFATVVVYSLVHIWSFNFMLVMAALVCGAFWGLLYRYHKNLMTLILSHAVWDVAVFLLFPIK